MQDHDWNDLKALLALHRAGSLAEAARRSAVSETTIARRLKRLEAALGTRLVAKGAHGLYALTEPAHAVLDHAERVEQENTALRDQLGQITRAQAAPVRISSVPVIIDRILIPSLHRLAEASPDLRVDLIPEPRAIDLTKREADLALRFSRPLAGGLAVKAQKVASLAFGIYAAATIAPREAPALPWISYTDGHGGLPQAHWTDTLRKRRRGGAAGVSVADLSSAIEAAASGLGLAVIPTAIGARDPRLRAVPIKDQPSAMARDVWLMAHADQTGRPSIEAAKAWLIGALTDRDPD